MTEQIQPVPTLAVTIAARSGQRSGTMTAKSVNSSDSRDIPNAAPIPKRPAKPWIARAGLFASPGRPRAAMPLLALLTPPALASDFSHQDFLTGNWGGTRDANHSFLLGHGLALQADLQYIIRPGGTGDIDNALVVGAKVSLDF